jgi:Ca-activated chloride channel family protein
MATAAGGNSWFVEGPEDFQSIFETEMKGLLKEVYTKVSMRIAPREGVQVIDVLNDFDLSEKGKYRLPNLLAGEPLDVIAKISLPGKELGSFPLFDLEVAWNPHGRSQRMYIEETAEVVYAPEDRVTSEPENSEVLKAIQLLKSARARREARTHMDRGEIGRAVNLLATHSLASKKMAEVNGDSDLDADAQALAELMKNIKNRGEHPLARKRIVYQSHYRQRGRSAVR